MEVRLMRTSDDKRKLEKSLTTVKTLTCRMKESTSILQPVLIVSLENVDNFATVNYCYIPKFKRYYFVGDIKTGQGGNLEIVCSGVDVLQTYKSQIKSLSTFVLRQEKVYNPYIYDGNLPTRVKRFREKKNIGTVGTSAENYYLTVNNGGD